MGLLSPPGSAAAASVAGQVLAGEASSYTQVELQARSNLLVNDNGYHLPPGSQFNSITPVINDAGQVAFRVQLVPDQVDPSAYHPGLWHGGHGDGGIVYTGPTDALADTDVSINASGDVAFTLSSGGTDNSLYRYDASTRTATRVGTSPVLPNSYRDPQIATAGDIGFQANFGGGRALAAYRGGAGVVYASDKTLDPGSPYTYIYTPSYNSAGQFAAKVATSDDYVTKVELRLFNADGSSKRILANQATDPASPYKAFNNSFAFNDAGTVAVIATRVDNKRVLVRSDGTTTTELVVADPQATVRDFEYFRPAINNAGQVAFRAVDAQGQAIYVSDDDSLVRVVGKADMVETDLGVGQIGQHDSSSVFGGAPSINSHGDVVFTAALHPKGNNQVEWGTGVFVAYAARSAPPYTLAINVGGGEYVDAAGQKWEADHPYSAGGWGYVADKKAKAESTQKDIAGTPDAALFQSRLTKFSSYRIDDLPAGTYAIDLGFAEFQQNVKLGSRVFSVRIGDQVVLKDHDVAVEVGGLAADQQQVVVEHRGGALVLEFSGDRTDPILNALRISTVTSR
ncbi:choice-of-anchor tandem repeat NxxGxxAF-containing protein [Micromonospora viridifaciens]|uniref:choice-of-anchor tandem repeat NxxGxxAF-containing protein n=1 Tax=Micromonospora viridifaciens TaxID=1881 RepID=UPI0012FE17C8|nr:choice-of-anchor tandem repeat NxxGxxAF-containing protein [Micromonospora viridifaciens]